jgi:DNA repair ATPase RecN
MKLVRKNGEDIAAVLTEQLQQLRQEHDKYKVDNNIDTYFEKFIDKDSGKRVLKDISDFLTRKSNEDEEVPFNVQKMLSELNFSQSTRTLDEVSEDLEHFMKMKVQYFVEDQKRETQTHDEGLHDEPMPPLVYGKQMNHKLQRQYEHGLGMTTKRVTNTLLSFLRKP